MGYEPVVHCRECGEPLDVYEAPENRFCCFECSDAFHDRKAKRDDDAMGRAHKHGAA